jgi:hypothetical protein
LISSLIIVCINYLANCIKSLTTASTNQWQSLKASMTGGSGFFFQREFRDHQTALIKGGTLMARKTST